MDAASAPFTTATAICYCKLQLLLHSTRTSATRHAGMEVSMRRCADCVLRMSDVRDASIAGRAVHKEMVGSWHMVIPEAEEEGHESLGCC